MNVSVIICAYTMDRWDELVAAVSSSVNQTAPPSEVVVVIDYHDELLVRAQLELAQARVVANRYTKGLSGARNTGVEVSTGDVIVFLDDDAFADREWLAALTVPFRDDAVAGAGGWILPYWPGEAPRWFPESFYWVLGCSYRGLPEDGASIRNPIGASMALRRRVFDAVGGFSADVGRIGKNALGCEETELCIRYGAVRPSERFVLSRSALVHHRVPASRLTAKYFHRRCWAEGLSKAVVASLVGGEQGLASERRHALRVVPRELAGALRAAPREPLNALVCATLSVTGLAVTTLGYLRGSLALRRGERRAEHSPWLARSPATTWRPIEWLTWNLDGDELPVSVATAPGDRVWVESRREGQVVGVNELTALEGGVAPSELEALREALGDETRHPLGEVEDSALPRASIVVPTIGARPEELSATVASLLALDYPNFEVIVVDNRPGGGRALLAGFDDVDQLRVVRQPRPGISAARNMGVTEAKGTFVAFTDDDVVVDRQWLRAIGERFVREPDVTSVAGLVLASGFDTEPQMWFEEFFGGFSKSFRYERSSLVERPSSDSLFPYAPGRFGAGCNMAFRREFLDEIGSFNERLGTGTPARGGEDLEMFVRSINGGGVHVFEPSALVRHRHRQTKSEFNRQVFGYGVGLGSMYCALVTNDLRDLLSLARRLPAGLQQFLAPRDGRSASRAPSYPRYAIFLQALGLLLSPTAYVRSTLFFHRSHHLS